MKKLKVAFFAEILIRDFDGATRTMFEIIDRIDRDDFEFLFFCGVPPKENIGFDVFHVPTLTLPFNKTYKMASMVGMGPKIESRLEEFAPDLIHVATPAPLGYFALKYALRHGLPVTTIYHTHFISYIKYYTNNAPIITSAFEAAVVQHNRSFYNRCSKVFVPTVTMKEELEEKGFDPDLMTIWPRGINLDIFNPGQRDEAFIRHLVGDDRMNILFASRLVWEKNLETLIDIYQMIEEKNLEYNLIIAGDGMAREELEAQMPKAHFTGHLNHVELSKLYASTDYFLFTSVTETYGNVVTEALACGAACLVADGGGSQSLIKEGINGFLCKPYSARDYLYKIQLLEDHPEFKKRMKKQAIKDMQNLKWGHIVAALFKEMEDLICDSDDHKKSKKPRISRASLPFLLDEWSSDFFYQRCTA